MIVLIDAPEMIESKNNVWTQKDGCPVSTFAELHLIVFTQQFLS